MGNTGIDQAIRRPGAILALISLPVFIGALDLTIVSAVLPNVIVDLRIPFQTGADDASWMVSGYLLAYTVSVAFMGRISDILGRRRTYFLALLIFILGSWLVATATFAPAAWMRTLARIFQGGRPDRATMALYALIAARVIQALGAGAMVPVSMALAGDLYPSEKRGTPLGIIGAVDTAGWVLGHLYGGLMVQFVRWEVLFWINIPITTLIAWLTWRQLRPIADSRNEGGIGKAGIAVITVGLGAVNGLALLSIVHAVFPAALERLLNEALSLNWLAGIVGLVLLLAIVLTLAAARRQRHIGEADWPGILLVALMLVGLNIGLGGGEAGTSTSLETRQAPPVSIPMLALAVLTLAGFILWERRSPHPLFALSYFRHRNISLAALINLLIGFCLMVGLVSVPLFVNTVVASNLDEAALLSGLLLGTLTIPMAAASIPGGMLTERFGYRLPTVTGLALAAVGFFLGRAWTPDVSYLTMSLHMALAGIGLGLTIAPIGTTVINAVRDSERGIASALVLIMRLVGMALGTSLMTNYGLRRLSTLTEQMVGALAGPPDVTALADIAVQASTRIINEMLLIAALVCLVAWLAGWLLRPRDRQ